jgi:DNA invertase Pin-like site-specific DNA recombinase
MHDPAAPARHPVHPALTVHQPVHQAIGRGALTGVYDPRGMGKMFFALLAGFAELEREMMTERTRDGLAQAAAEGRHGARRPVISRGLTYKTAGGQERTVSRRALYNAFRAHDTEQAAGTA